MKNRGFLYSFVNNTIILIKFESYYFALLKKSSNVFLFLRRLFYKCVFFKFIDPYMKRTI